MLMAARTGHLGPTVFRSTNSGRTWREARRPPAFPKVADGPDAKVVERTFWLSPGHPSQPGTWYAGTSPHGLFRSDDGGVSWEPVSGFNEYVDVLKRREGYIGRTPGGPLTHSILVDPRGPDHLYVGLSTGGFFESLDGGATWRPLNKGVAAYFLPVKDAEYGHDPHCVALHPANPDRPTPARPGRGVGLPDGRHESLAANKPWGTPGGLPESGWGTLVAAAGPGAAPPAGLVHRDAARVRSGHA
jgi:hypothetical protein